MALVGNTFKVETDGNLGAVEIATFLSLVLLGVSLSQGYTYFRRSASDKWTLKLMVSPFFCVPLITLKHCSRAHLYCRVLEMFHSFTAAHTIYFDTVTRFNRAEINSYSLSANVVNETLITVVVQSFFSHRIYRLSGNLAISFACFALTVLRFLGGIAMSAESIIDVHRTPNWVVFITKYNWLVTSALALGGATDILIAASMLFYLRKLASSGNMRSTTQLLNRLVRYSLLVWFGLYIILAKVYSNSLLASLNARPRSERHPNRQRAMSTGIDFGTAPRAITVPFHVSNPTDTSESDWPSSSQPSSSQNRGASKTFNLEEEAHSGVKATDNMG
ncbi:hypothetical protein CVT25_006105 [Psilocybe cyanescens]|uniref:DUF6534 domain-containing protein n=1 Tax=Psilocybe cyanescens TaxID=93625 RepID=A0A409XIJ0_PSICY|nr:hypothetical protein CVT25_006105 [Psilocybe cyanescens]